MDANDENKMNEIFSKLESNNIISYKYSINNKIYMNFELNEVEKECFSIIMNILKKNNLNSVISRVAGGWVRDKLLGKESDDIDIAVSGINANDLVKIINEELYSGKSKIGIIKQNPNRGKNVEVITTKICKISIDFVNLRTKDKDGIPSPLSDAEFRDISINSLFYNINEQKVEDFTKRGIKDLENGIIETPIEPNIGLKNDPFIIIRMLRFAIKYKFRIEKDINDYIQKNGKDILDEFCTKVSKQRLEKEMTKIFLIDNSEFIIAYLYSFNILDILFFLKDYDLHYNYDNLFLKVTNLYILGHYLLKRGEKIFEIELNSDNFNKIDYSFLLLTLFFRNFKYKDTYLNHKILSTTYKTSIEHRNENNFMCKNFDELLKIINENKYERFPIFKVLKKIHINNIIHVLLASIAYEYIESVKLDFILSEIDEDVLQKIIDKNKKFYDYVKNEDLLHLDKMKPLINAKEIAELLNIKGNKEIGTIKNYLMDEQIKNPKLSKEEAIELIKKKREELFPNSDDNCNRISGKKNEK